MLKIVHFTFFVLLILGVTFFLLNNQGTVTISWLGYIVETNLVLVFFAFLLLLCLIYVIKLPFRFMGWMHSCVSKQKEATKENLLNQMLSAVASGDEEAGKKLAEKLDKTFAKDSSTSLLLKVLCSPSLSLYKELADNPKTELAGWRGMIDDLEKKGELPEALELAQKALKKYPRIPWLLEKNLNLQVLNSQWKEAFNTLSVIKKNGIKDEKDFLTKKACLLIKMNKGYEAFKIAPWLPAAALAAVEEKPKKAEAIIFKAWSLQPQFRLYKAYVSSFKKENSLALYKRTEKLVEQNKAAPINHIVLADAALQAKLWETARKELETYMASHTINMQVATMMAFLEQEGTRDHGEAQRWINMMQTLEPNSSYVCSVCKHKTDRWNVSCPVCNAFSSFKSL